MSLPFYISCPSPSVNLIELSDGRFQLTKQGPISPFMAGYHYLLVEHALGAFLSELDMPGVRCAPATIFNRGTKEEHHTHTRVFIAQFFRADQIRDLLLEDCRLLTMGDQYYFASPALKFSLEQARFKYLRFTEGLSEFAANSN